MKLVNIHTGEVFTPKWIDKEKKQFSNIVNADGSPDKRVKTKSYGLYRWMDNDFITGDYAEYDPVVEEKATALRKRMTALSIELETLRKQKGFLYPYENRGPND
jgi:hypothetical protein